jgi:hypothetical protein
MKMKKSWNGGVLTVLLFIFWSCSNRKDFIQSLDQKPKIYIKEYDSLLYFYQDSVKINRSLNSFSSIDLLVKSSEGISSLNFERTSGSGLLRFRGDSILNNSLNPVNGELILKYIPQKPGLSEYHFTVKDKFQGKDSVVYKVLSFINLPPIASCYVSPIKIIDPLEYEINASGSFDQDRNYGGGIVSYIFFINGQTIKTSQPVIKYIFSGAGQYSISVQVEDNDSALSNLFSTTVLIN